MPDNGTSVVKKRIFDAVVGRLSKSSSTTNQKKSNGCQDNEPKQNIEDKTGDTNLARTDARLGWQGAQSRHIRGARGSSFRRARPNRTHNIMMQFALTVLKRARKVARLAVHVIVGNAVRNETIV